ncbi:MAG: phosphate/phosphite/phosphonate ABC transporter substrate-binding protein [Ruegeria sp.]
MIAALGMYDMPATAQANDRFWSLTRSALGFGPERLTRDRDMWDVWTHPDLVLAQTCGMPYRTKLQGQVQLVGTPDYGLPGCPPGHYCSVFVARRTDQRDLSELIDGVFGYNESLSQSGWAAPITHLAGQNLKPETLLETGGHANSAHAVANEQADVASLDALTWTMLQEHTKLGEQLREVARTPPTPTLPYITAPKQDPDRIAHAVRSAINELSDQDRRLLHLKDLTQIPTEKYLSVPNPPSPEAIVATN